MKARIGIFVLLNFLFSFAVMAQFPNPADFNTATNGTNTGTLAVGTNDLHWEVSITNSVTGFVPAKSCGRVYWGYAVSPFINTNWISYPHTCVPGDWAEHSCLNPANLDMYYKLLVTLPATNCGQSINTASVYCLTFDFFADNTVWRILVNGVSNYQNTATNPYYMMDYSPGQNKTVSLCNGWMAGTNTVLVHVKSGAGTAPTWESFLAQANQTVNINTGTGQTIIASSTKTNVSCNGFSNGSASVTVPGIGPFSYSWSPSGGTGPTASGLSPGIYSVVITHSVSCSATQTILITQPAPVSISASTVPVSCNGLSNGSASINASGAGPFTYSWSPSGGNGPMASGLSAGIYSVVITNSVPCSATQTILITQPAPVSTSASTVPVSCNGLSNGSASITASGAGPFTYSWLPSGGTGPMASGLSAGTYSVVITNSVPCSATQTILITQPAPIPISFSTVPVSCNGLTNGSASVTVSGAGPFTYSWSPSGGTGPMASGLSAGIYSVVITNSAPCSATQAILITQPAPIPISVSTVPVKCKGVKITFTAAGATSYAWQPGNFTGSMVSVTPTVTTTYSVTGTDLNGCTTTYTFTQIVSQCNGLQDTEADEQVAVFPNPVNDQLRISGQSVEAEIRIYDLNGRIVMTSKLSPPATTLDTSELKEGVYTMKVFFDQQVISRKIVRIAER